MENAFINQLCRTTAQSAAQNRKQKKLPTKEKSTWWTVRHMTYGGRAFFVFCDGVVASEPIIQLPVPGDSQRYKPAR